MSDAPTSRSSGRPLDLLVVGELNVDLILEGLNALPALETERTADGMTLTMGSSSAIVAANAAALGLGVSFVGRVGDDAFGRLVLDRLTERGVATDAVVVDAGAATGATVVYTRAGSRGMLTYPGAMRDLTASDVPAALVASARHVHVSSYYLQPGLQSGLPALFAAARAGGASTSFDTNWDPDERWEGGVLDVLEHVDIFLPNADEARRLAGDDDLDGALMRLAERAGAVVATCGADGVRARRGEETWTLPAPRVEPVDAVGAGDSFNAGFLAALLGGRSFPDALRSGLVAGAYSTTRAGGTAAFDDPAAFRRFAAAHGAPFPAAPARDRRTHSTRPDGRLP